MRKIEGNRYVNKILKDLDKKIAPKEQLDFYTKLLKKYINI